MIKAEWRIIKIAPCYEVSNTGHVRKIKTKWELKQTVSNTKSPRLIVFLREGLDYTATARVADLVAHAFLPNPDNCIHAVNIDGDYTNNMLYNLEWFVPQTVRLKREKEQVKDTYKVYKFYNVAYGEIICESDKFLEKYEIRRDRFSQLLKGSSVNGWVIRDENKITLLEGLNNFCKLTPFFMEKSAIEKKIPELDKIMKQLYTQVSGKPPQFLGDFYAYDRSWRYLMHVIFQRYMADNKLL